MSNKLRQNLQSLLADALGLQMGGLPGVKGGAPANDHHYLLNEVIDHDTENTIVTQYLNFEEQLDNVVALFISHLQQGLDYVIGDDDTLLLSGYDEGPDGLVAWSSGKLRDKNYPKEERNRLRLEQRQRAAEWLGGDK